MSKRESWAGFFCYLCEKGPLSLWNGKVEFPTPTSYLGYWWASGVGLLDTHTTAAVLAQCCRMPGECSFLKSPNDLQVPLPASHGAQAVLLAVGTAWALCIPFLRWSGGGLLFLAQKHRKRGDAKASMLAQRRDCAAELGLKHCACCPFWFIFTWHLYSMEIEESTPEGCSKLAVLQNTEGEKWGQLKDNEDAPVRMSTATLSSPHFLETFFLSSKASMDQARQGKGKFPQSSTCHLTPHVKPWWTQAKASETEAEGQSWPQETASQLKDWAFQ